MPHRLPGLLAMAAIVLAPLALADWIVDDAAISYAFAENLAHGEGLVAVPGGERVEGYSNPTWVALLAIGAVLGLELMGLSKLLATLASVGAGFIAWRGARSGLAPVFLAVSAPFVIWTASGLENPLFTLLLMAGWLAGHERRFTLSGVLFGLLALTRPEALVYGLVAGVLFQLQHGGTTRFWPGLLGLFAAHEAFRIAYFAWPLPNTYYAKLGEPITRWGWDARGWVQLRQWAWETGAIAMLPVVVIGARRLPVLAVLALLPAAFSVYAGGDWMRGYRWMSLAAGPLAVLAAAGMVHLQKRLGTRAAWLLGGLVLGALLPTNILALRAFRAHPVDYPAMIERRLDYIQGIADRLQIPHRDRSTLEMDMGAHLWHSDLQVVDLAGLVDVPIAHHRFADRDFMRAYVFEERRPLFAHVHRHWARVSGLHGYPEWKRDYVALPPYDDGGRPHDGVFIRRDAVERPWTGARRNDAIGGLTLVGARLPTAATHAAQIQLAFERADDEQQPLFLEIAGRRHPIDPTLGVLSVDRWRGTVQGPHTIAVDAPLGRHPAVLIAGSNRIWLGDLEIVDDLTPHRQDALEAIRGPDCAAAEQAWERLHQLTPGEDALEDQGATQVASCWLGQGTVDSVKRARHWDHRVPGYAEVAAPLAEARLEQARQASGSEAVDAYEDVLDLQPQRAWARRALEALR